MTLEEILQKHFNCKKVFLKNKKFIEECSNGEKTYDYFTNSGAKAYNNLTILLYDLQKLIPEFNVNNIVGTLDEICDEYY